MQTAHMRGVVRSGLIVLHSLADCKDAGEDSSFAGELDILHPDYRVTESGD